MNDVNDAANDAPGWQTYQDPRFGFRVALPEGWALHADEQAIHLWNPDGSVFALVTPFHYNPVGPPGIGEDVQRIVALPSSQPMLFPQAVVQRITPAPPQGSGQDGDTVGEFSYQSAQGGGQARVLLSRRQGGGGGMLFTIAAPTARFESEKPTLLRILGSLQFGVGPIGDDVPANAQNAPQSQNSQQNGPGNAAVSGGVSGGAGRAPNDQAAKERAMAEVGQRMQWTRWSDPRENSFHVEVPQGWTVEGGAFRYGVTDVRKSVRAHSPEGDTTVQVGDPNIALFEAPSQMTQFMGLREGQVYSPTGTFQATIAPYISARGFGRWYLTNFLQSEVEGATPTKEEDLIEPSRQQTMQMQQNGILGGRVEVASVGFRGRGRHTGKPITGELLVTVTHFPPGPMGGGNWAANPIWSITDDDGDAASEARKAIAGAAILHLMKSWQEDPAWTAQHNQASAQVTQQMQQTAQDSMQRTHQMAMDSIHQAGERSRMIARQGDERRQASMDSFHQRMATQDNTQRQFVNYLGDRTDVRDPSSGQAWNVGSGHGHYYHDARTDTVLGTDSASSPGVDWTRLDEF